MDAAAESIASDRITPVFAVSNVSGMGLPLLRAFVANLRRNKARDDDPSMKVMIRDECIGGANVTTIDEVKKTVFCPSRAYYCLCLIHSAAVRYDTSESGFVYRCPRSAPGVVALYPRPDLCSVPKYSFVTR